MKPESGSLFQSVVDFPAVPFELLDAVYSVKRLKVVDRATLDQKIAGRGSQWAYSLLSAYTECERTANILRVEISPEFRGPLAGFHKVRVGPVNLSDASLWLSLRIAGSEIVGGENKFHQRRTRVVCSGASFTLRFYLIESCPIAGELPSVDIKDWSYYDTEDGPSSSGMPREYKTIRRMDLTTHARIMGCSLIVF